MTLPDTYSTEAGGLGALPGGILVISGAYLCRSDWNAALYQLSGGGGDAGVVTVDASDITPAGRQF